MPELNWVGKSKVLTHHFNVPYRVLKRQYSFDEKGEHSGDNNSENMVIHGDNLEALKALLPKFEGKVDCVYIDPPYNTGNEKWIYNDAVNDPRINKWLGEVVGKEGEDLNRHDKWLCMMYPRLRLLHLLLSPSGVIFISIDENEAANLKLICDEIFGRANFVSSIAVGNNQKGRSDQQYFATAHETLLVYRKSSLLRLGGFQPGENVTKRYRKKDPDGRLWREIDLRKTGANDRREDRPNMFFPLYWDEKSRTVSLVPSEGSREIFPMKSSDQEGRWRVSRETVVERASHLFARYMPNKNQWSVFEKDYLDERSSVKPTTLLLDKKANTERGTEQARAIFGNSPTLEFPKPVGFIELLLSLVTTKDPLVLDSFAGSGTTGHAVLNLNNRNGYNGRFILVELGDYADAITAERLRRVIQGYGEGKNEVEGTGGSFSFYELGEQVLVQGKINPAVSSERIREYIWFTETGLQFDPNVSNLHPDFLGSTSYTSYFFNHQANRTSTLNREYLASIPKACAADEYVIFADTCLLSEKELRGLGVTFKKIPRDIRWL